MSIKIKYKLTGTGWAEAKFVMPRKTIKIEISYLCNPLPELIKGILDITNSKKEFVEVLFSHEPGETKLQIVKLSKTELQISFYHYPEGTFPSQLSYSFDKSKSCLAVFIR